MSRPLTLGVVLLVGLGVGGYFLVQYLFAPPEGGTQPPDVGPARARQAIPVPAVRFTDTTAAAGLRFRHFNGATGKKLLPETMGGGVAILDYDRDGHQDILFTNGCPWPGQPIPEKAPCLALYRNQGDGTFADVSEAAGLAVSLYGMGVAVGDIDNDGYPDVYVTGVGDNRLFHNVAGAGGTRKFSDITKSAGVGGAGGWPAGAKPDEFYQHKAPIPFGASATFLDYDGDGKLDLFVTYYVTWSPAIDLAIDSTLSGVGRAYLQPQQFEGARCALYRNVDGVKFADVSAQAGVEVTDREGTGETARVRAVGKSLGVIACDADGDGWPDLVVANDTVRNFFFHNVPAEGGGRRYEEIGLLANVAYAEGQRRGAMGIDWGEYRPGKNALVIANFANEPDTFLTLDNPKRLQFSDSALAVGLAGPSRPPLKFGAFFFDYDNDGRLDLLTCNGHLEPEITKVQKAQQYEQPVQLFWNTGGGQRLYEPVTAEQSGADLFAPLVGRGCAFLDYNGDGRLDLVLVANNGPARLVRNDSKLGHHAVRLVLEGDGVTSNRSALGAEVIVTSGDVTVRRQVTGARGYLSQCELPVTVGLGVATKIDKIEVRWPGKDAGKPQVWTDLAADRVYELKHGVEQAKVLGTFEGKP